MSEHNHMMGLPNWLKMLVALAIVFVLVTMGINELKQNKYIGKPLDYKNSITMTGEGKVVAVPDVMKTSFGYTATKSTVAAAQQETVQKMNDFIQVLKNKGVAEEDIKTTNYSVYPQYDYVNGRSSLRGYTVSQNIEVTLRDFDEASNIIGVAAESGLNQVGNLRFTFDDPEEFRQEARIEAIKQAKEKAESLASEAGVKLGDIIGISENYGGYPTPYATLERFDAGIGAGGGGDIAPDVSAGSSEITVSVNITYEVL